jgi:hypothetical protein|tara:strand:+ start:355 stop:519 length:165 start_codon:yes stop_codon:yes gene_type:complete
MPDTWTEEKHGLTELEDQYFNSTTGDVGLKKFDAIESTFATLFTEESITTVEVS